jgi:hypothetical protein
MAEKTKSELLREIRELRRRLRQHDLRFLRAKSSETVAADSPISLVDSKETARRAHDTPGSFQWLCDRIFAHVPCRIAWTEVGRDGHILQFGGRDLSAMFGRGAVSAGRCLDDFLCETERARWQRYLAKLNDRNSPDHLCLHLESESFQSPISAVAFPSGAKFETLNVLLIAPTYDPATRGSNEVRQWAGIFAHELNQPLAAALATAQAFRRITAQGSTDAEETVEILDGLVRRIQHAADVVRGLRLIAQNDPPRRVPGDVVACGQQALEMLRPVAAQHRVTVGFEAEPMPPLEFDPAQITQVIVNLARNAIEAMAEVPQDRRRLDVEFRTEMGQVVVSVIDQGIGLSVDAIRQLFEPLASSKAGGMGLGLAVCRKVIERHGGRIWAEARSPHGCRFSFSIPLPVEAP